MDAIDSPHKIIFGHLLYQVDTSGGQPETTAAVAGFEFPKEPEALTMLAQQDVGFEDEKNMLPVVDAAREKDQSTGDPIE